VTRRLEGKAALVTGAGRGLGREIAARLAREGAEVALHYHRSADGARALAAEIAAGGGKAIEIAGDLRDIDACARIVADAEGALGRLDILVLNAGIAKGGPMMAGDVAGRRETIEVKLLA
jgi:NAD(P)-dependent dehydrogenase (short-subunit alcohol dehydrogenase family)